MVMLLMFWILITCLCVGGPAYILAGDQIGAWTKRNCVSLAQKLPHRQLEQIDQVAGFAPLGDTKLAKSERDTELNEWWEQRFEVEVGAYPFREAYFKVTDEIINLQTQFSDAQNPRYYRDRWGDLTREGETLNNKIEEGKALRSEAAKQWAQRMGYPEGTTPKKYRYLRLYQPNQNELSLPSGTSQRRLV